MRIRGGGGGGGLGGQPSPPPPPPWGTPKLHKEGKHRVCVLQIHILVVYSYPEHNLHPCFPCKTLYPPLPITGQMTITIEGSWEPRDTGDTGDTGHSHQLAHFDVACVFFFGIENNYNNRTSHSWIRHPPPPPVAIV